MIPEDSLESFFEPQECGECIKVLSEKQTEGEVSTLYILPSAFEELNMQINWRAKTPINLNEQGGILIGSVYKDKASQLVCGVVQHIIPSTKTGNAVYIQFSHEDWISMYKEFEEKYSASEGDNRSLSVIGWYHTHPNMPVNMSDIDKRTHTSFFPEAYQFSVIFNPQRGIWAVFNGKECENCNGVLYYMHNENEILQAQDEDGSNLTAAFNFGDNEAATYNPESVSIPESSSFVVKRRSSDSPYDEQDKFSIQRKSSNQNIQFRSNENRNSVPTYRIEKMSYEGHGVQIGSDYYYYPLNIRDAGSEKSYFISDVLVRCFITFVDEWNVTDDGAIALFYPLNVTKPPLTSRDSISTMLYGHSGLAVDGFCFAVNSNEFVEYVAEIFKGNVVIAVVYSSKKVRSSFWNRVYERCDCVLWINPAKKRDFKFYSFNRSKKRVGIDFNIKKGTFFNQESDIRRQLQRENEALKHIIVGISHLNQEEDGYVQTECDGLFQEKAPLKIRTQYLEQFIQRIKGYSKINSNFSIIISFLDYADSKGETVNPSMDSFLQIWAFWQSNSNNEQSVFLKKLIEDVDGKASIIPKFAFVISNWDVNINDLKSKLAGHRTAFVLNIEALSYAFHKLL